jgi:O-antigen ligase
VIPVFVNVLSLSYSIFELKGVELLNSGTLVTFVVLVFKEVLVLFMWDFNSFFRSSWLLYSLLSGFMLSVAILPSVSDIFIALLLLTSIALLCFARFGGGFRMEVSEKVIVLIFVVYALISLISFFGWPISRGAQMRLEDDLKFLFFLPLYFVFRRVDFDIRLIKGLFVFLCLLLALVAVFQYILLVFFDLNYTLHGIRVSGGVHPMRYAVFVLISVTFTVNIFILKKIRRGRLVLLVMLVILGLVACVLTQTRGVWLSIPFLVVLYSWCLLKKGRVKGVALFWLGAFLSIVLISKVGFVQDRVEMTHKNIQLYQKGNGHTSLGARLDMYKFSIGLIAENPVWGHGLNSFERKSKEYREQGLFGESVSNELGVRRTPHNEFVQAFIEKGVVGLLLTIFLFSLPGYVFYRAVKSKSGDSIFYGLCGLSMLLVFFVSGQTGTVFNHNVFTHFYIVMVLFFVSQVRVLEDKEEAGLVEG